jgi:hypothetical protein
MSANDYYNAQSQQPQSHQPYQSYRPSPQSLPSYRSEAPVKHLAQPPLDTSPVSPFETPFDDHVYPSGVDGAQSQSTLGPDTRYYGQQGGRAATSQNSFADNIPLQDHPGKPGVENPSTDHVYDAPAAPPRVMEEGRSKRRGGFGRLQSPKKRIAWVVYTLTLIQVAVFIAEIVKNGR